MWSAPNATAITSHAGNFRQASAAGKEYQTDGARTIRSVALGAIVGRLAFRPAPGTPARAWRCVIAPPRLPTGAGSPVDLIALR
jgi:hypothetical protein